MNIIKQAYEINKHDWEIDVLKKSDYTILWLDLDPKIYKDYADGKINTLPDSFFDESKHRILKNAKGKKVLCLASGGGQQTAVFGLLGADVTSFDMTEGQLDADRKAADHYGYDIKTIQGDMSDLSCFDDETFDIVFQAISIVFAPDVRVVYKGVHRILKKMDCTW